MRGAALWGGRARYEGMGGGGPGELRHTLDVDPALVPVLPAHRKIRARLERLGPVTGEQGEGGDHACLFAGGKAGQLVEISEISRSPAARGVEREQGRKNSKGAPAFGEPARTARRRCHYQSGGSCATSDPHGEAVVAVFQDGREPHHASVHGAPVEALAHNGREVVAPNPPFDPVAVVRLDGALELGVRLAQPQGDLTARGVIEDDDGLDDPFDSGTAPAAKQAAGVAGLADGGSEGLQYRDEHFWIGPAPGPGVVQVLEHDARVRGERPQGRRDEGRRGHDRSQSDQVMRFGTKGCSRAG